jgi:hypothetical protein
MATKTKQCLIAALLLAGAFAVAHAADQAPADDWIRQAFDQGGFAGGYRGASL